MENKRSYGRRKTDENRQTSPTRGARPRRAYDKDEREKRPVRKTFTKKAKPAENDGLVRLNKFIANSGVCSRREADTFIENGLVSVNGVRVTELGTKVDPVKDDIRFNGSRIKGEKKVYLVMNKPKDFVTTLTDPHAERTVMDLISKSLCPERVFPVGRLDKATTGVLLFTNDGDLTHKLTHPKHEVRKIYHATLDKNLKKEDFDKILEGIELEDGPIAADALSYVEDDKTQVGLEIHSGRNRIVRRIFEHLGYKVKKLDRVYFAGLTKKNLRRGAWRFLEEKEVNMLKMGAFE
jgi:23S rRNA pseudouridine2605 synthase